MGQSVCSAAGGGSTNLQSNPTFDLVDMAVSLDIFNPPPRLFAIFGTSSKHMTKA